MRPGRRSIRIYFSWNGEQCFETLDLAPTPANTKYATRLVAEIKSRIKLGTFRYGEFFPESPRAGVADRGDRSFGFFVQLYLKSVGRNANSTKSQYRNALVFFAKQLAQARSIEPADGNYAAAGFAIAVNTVNHAELAALIGGYEWPSFRTCNNYLIPLRGVFDLAARTLKFD
ncbi:MAG: DUF3596 domain-containing protein, partial [Burkholderiales bacterium]